MAVTQAYSGTETVSTTEWSLTTDTSWSSADAQTTAGIYQLWLDLSALAAGDVFELKGYEKVLSGGTQRVFMVRRFANAQAEPNPPFPALMLMHGWDYSLKKISGTDRSIDWSIRTA